MFEQQTVFRDFDRFALGADHLDAVFFQHPRVVQRDCQIQRGLATNGWQQGIGLFFADNRGNRFDGERLDVGPVSGLRIGHDRRRVRINQHHFVALLMQGFAGLRARIVEFAGLANDDRTGTNNQDFMDISALGHPNQQQFSVVVFAGDYTLTHCEALNHLP